MTNRKPSYRELEQENKALREAFESAIAVGHLHVIVSPDVSELELERITGYQIGAMNTMLMAKSMVGIEVYSGLINRAAWRMSGKDLIAEIDELTPKLSQLVTQWRNDAVKSKIAEARINYVIGIASNIQDAAKAALEGDEGAAIRALFPDKALSRAFPHEGDRLMNERFYVGKRAKAMRRYKKYKQYGGWINIGLDLIDELEKRDLSDDPAAKDALSWLKLWQHDRKTMSERIQDAYKDYEKLRITD